MKDPRYKIVKEKIKSGEITMFSQMFDYIPAELVARDLWLLQNPKYNEVPDTKKAKEEIEIWIQKLKYPRFTPELILALKAASESAN